MKYILTLCIACLSLALFQSCTMQKRRYMDGWHVDWHSRKQEVTTDLRQPTESIVKADTSAPLNSAGKDAVGKAENETSASDAAFIPENRIDVSNQPSPKTRIDSKTETPRHMKIGQEMFQGRAVKLDSLQSTTGGKVLGLIGFILLVISVAILLIGMIAQLGWTSLGLVIMAMLVAALAFVFALVAWMANRHAGDITPWYVWLTLFVGGLAVLLWLKVLLDRA